MRGNTHGRVAQLMASITGAALVLVSVAARAADGDLDPGFGTGGRATFNWADGMSRPYAIAIDGQGRIVLVGTASSYAGYTSPQYMATRVLPTGVQDST